MRPIALATLAVVALTAAGGAQQPPRGPSREIVQVKGDLYRARTNNYFAVFLVTPEGIILADPINTAFATWLKEQFAERFKVPVRYVIYSHSHWDHIEGAAVFADTARIVAHENVGKNMDGRIPQMPGDMLDRNNNGRFELNEIVDPLTNNGGRCGMPAGFFRTADRNGDGSLTPAELQADIRKPDILYSERMQLSLGGKRVELIYPGRNHSDDATVVHFPAERVVFATEFISDVALPATASPRAFPSACGPFDGNPLSEWIRSYRTVEALDFDTFAGGHGALATKADVTAVREFFEDLVAAVSAGMTQGKSLAELQQTLLFEKYKDWNGYAVRRAPTIESAYTNLRLYR
jgi:glyoxylase-like metal-dependent hydrolase (beta-lactamase superfamily II)